MAIGQDKQSVVCNVGTTAAGTDDEIPVFIAPYNCYIKKAYLVNGAAVSADGTNYTTLSVLNKSSDGSGTDVIASFDTDANNDNVSLTAHKTQDFGSVSNESLSVGDVVSFKKADSGSGQAITTGSVVIVFESKGGLVQY